jgi:hypothetical protein
MLQFDCALSLQELYGIIATLRFSFPIILVYPCYNSYRLLAMVKWSKDHVLVIGAYTLILLEINVG